MKSYTVRIANQKQKLDYDLEKMKICSLDSGAYKLNITQLRGLEDILPNIVKYLTIKEIANLKETCSTLYNVITHTYQIKRLCSEKALIQIDETFFQILELCKAYKHFQISLYEIIQHKIKEDINANENVIKSLAYDLKVFKTAVLQPDQLEAEIIYLNKRSKALDQHRETINSTRLLLILISNYHNMQPFAPPTIPGLITYLQYFYLDDKDEYLQWLHTKMTTITIEFWPPFHLRHKALQKHIPTGKFDQVRQIWHAHHDIITFINKLTTITDRAKIDIEKIKPLIENQHINQNNVQLYFDTSKYDIFDQCLFMATFKPDPWTRSSRVHFDINLQYNS